MLLEKIGCCKNWFYAVIILCFTSNGEVIILQKRRDHELYGEYWGVPAGKVKRNELSIWAAVREVKEETGYTCTERDLIELPSIYPSEHIGKNGKIITFVGQVFILNKPIDHVHLSAEHENFLKVAPHLLFELPDEDLVPDFKKSLWDGLIHIEENPLLTKLKEAIIQNKSGYPTR